MHGPSVPVLGLLLCVLSSGCHDNLHGEAVSGEGAGKEMGKMLITVRPGESQDFSGVDGFDNQWLLTKN